jgi:hypothetical protein
LYGSRGAHDVWRFDGRVGPAGDDRSDGRHTWSGSRDEQRRARRSTGRREDVRPRRDRSTTVEREHSGERRSDRTGNTSRSGRLRGTDEEPRVARRAGVRRLENGRASEAPTRERDGNDSVDE